MIDENAIRQRLENFEFQGYAKAVSKLLSAFGILETTIAKITSKIDQGESGPFYVYRRAVVYCTEDMVSAEEYISAKRTMPLLIVFTPRQIIITNEYIGRVICDYVDVATYINYLAPLQSWDINRNDHYSTLKLDSLVESLYRELILNDNDEENTRCFIFSLLYMAHFSTVLEMSQVQESIKGYNKSDKEKLSKVFDLFFAWKCPFVTDNTRYLLLSNDAYKYIFAILQFDTNLIDAEFLTSLIYKMTCKDEAGLYGHQTSFINVEKLLQPLFLNEMQRKANASTTENVFQVVTEIYNTRVLDPTNGPGCYLVASYNGLLQQLRDIEIKFDITCGDPLHIDQFIGLVSNELTRELSRLALTFVHSSELKRLGLLSIDSIQDTYHQLAIHVGDELNTPWNNYVSPADFVYVVGSPDFKGNNKIPASAKQAMLRIFESKQLNSADYCSAWLMKAARFISGTPAKAAFVLTNSVSQGTQSTFILDKINEAGCEYIFAHRSFKWKTSNDNSGVTVVIIGIGTKGQLSRKYLFEGGKEFRCQEIGASLLPDIDIRVKSRTTPLSPLLPHMCKGNMPDGATFLTFTSTELDAFLDAYPEATKFIKPLYGGEEFVKGKPKWVLWITDNELEEAKQIQGIADRIEQVRQQRHKPSSTSSDKSKANPHKFREDRTTSKGKVSLIVPCVTSENRQYFQMGILGSNTIVNNNVSVVFDCDIWLLALLESRMHEVWAKNACGGHETRPRYSSALCYNTFPVPDLTSKQISTLRNLSRTLLEVREKYCDKSLADMYLKMPPELVRVHKLIDDTVDSYYRNQPFSSNEERLMWLKNMYNTLIDNE